MFARISIFIVTVLFTIYSSLSQAQVMQTKGGFEDSFRPLDQVLLTLNVYQHAVGAAEYKYWQQVDYDK